MEKFGVRSLSDQYAEFYQDHPLSNGTEHPQPFLASAKHGRSRVRSRSNSFSSSIDFSDSADAIRTRRRCSESHASYYCQTFRRSRALLLNESYTYKPLPEGPRIRILTLWSGNESDPIRCSLHEVLHERVFGKYEALSHVWNPKELCGFSRRTILINDRTFKIYENLFQFLVTSRSPDSNLELWIDAICIDQSSTSEKNDQVQRMASIYKYARQTRVWLGRGNPHIDSCLRWFNWVVAEMESGSANTQVRAAYTRYNEKTVIRHPLTKFPSFLKERALSFVCDHEYWQRLWIIQEVILSKVVYVQMSLHLVGFNDLIGFTNMRDNIEPEFRRTQDRNTMYQLWRERLSESPRNFQSLVRDYSKAACLDARDRVFGLLGLIDQIPVRVDYNLSRLDLFHHVMQSIAPDFMHELAGPLAFALLVPDEIVGFRADVSLLRSTIPIRLVNIGFVVDRDEHLTWTLASRCSMLVHSFGSDPTTPGDTLYSLRDFSGSQDGQDRFLFVLRQVPVADPSTTERVRYQVAGTLLAVHAEQNLERLAVTFGNDMNEIGRGAYAWRRKESSHEQEDGMLTTAAKQAVLDLPIADIRKMRWAHWAWGRFEDGLWR